MHIRYFFMALMLSAQSVLAEPGRSSYDVNNNGLIEINDLADLDEIRRNLEGKSLYGSSAGCPASGCRGFELTSDLDFDTNKNGFADIADAFWNNGEGWLPLGAGVGPFTAVFDGRGHSIRNFYINIKKAPASVFPVGLFSTLKNAQVSHLVIGGSTQVVCVVNTCADMGLLAGSAADSSFSEIALQGYLKGGQWMGGLAGVALNSQFNAIALAINGVGDWYMLNGVAGDADAKTVMSNVAFFGRLQEDGSFFDQIGLAQFKSNASTSIGHFTLLNLPSTNSPLRMQPKLLYFAEAEVNPPFSLAELTCPTAANDTACSARPLYTDWDKQVDAKGQPYWDFGTEQQLPGLRLLGRVYRDSDKDGLWDDEDAFPLHEYFSLDTDGDGAPDGLTQNGISKDLINVCDNDCVLQSGLLIDAFPNQAAVSQDADGDGLADRWNPSCDAACQQASAVSLDRFPNDADNDGLSDGQDSDDNGDGEVDADRDSNGLIEISSLAQLRAVAFNSAGTGRTPTAVSAPDSSGCPRVYLSRRYQPRCHGYELTQDLDFDTNHSGQADAGDEFWNDGQGWEPIALSTEFDGRGFSILNLMVNRKEGNVGLFSHLHGSETRDAFVHRLVLRGPQTSVSGHSVGGPGANSVGLLAGYAGYARIEEVAVSGRVVSNGDGTPVGGLLGTAAHTKMKAIAAAVSVRGLGWRFGALVGSSEYISTLHTSFVTGQMSSPRPLVVADFYELASLINANGEEPSVVNSFSSVAEANTGLFVAAQGVDYSGLRAGYAGMKNSYFVRSALPFKWGGAFTNYTLEELSCPTRPSDSACKGYLLFPGWNKDTDAQGRIYWDMGTNQQLPGLRMFGRLFRDSDGDGSFDEDDKAPLSLAYSLDADADGAPDAWSFGCDKTCQAASKLNLDQFPRSAAAWADADLDGLPDAWAAQCDDACRSASGLRLDAYPNDADNDGTPDNKDTQHNGKPSSDANGNGLVEIHNLTELDAMRYALNGEGRRLTQSASLDVSGCPVRLVEGVHTRSCWGYELVSSLNFDTNANGKLDTKDTFYNEGKGWLPIGSSDAPFMAVFDGQGFKISNLVVNGARNQYQGLFGAARASTFKNLVIDGAQTQVTGGSSVGLLVGYAYSSRFAELALYGTVNGADALGGMAGLLTHAEVNGVFVDATLATEEQQGHGLGGIAGESLSGVFANLSVTGKITGPEMVGGLVGGIDLPRPYEYVSNQISSSLSTMQFTKYRKSEKPVLDPHAVLALDSDVQNSYYLNQASIKPESLGAGFNLEKLQCPTAANDTLCTGSKLYTGWDKALNAAGQPMWDFGTNTQLPGLRLMGRVYRSGSTVTPAANQAPSVSLSLSQHNTVQSHAYLNQGDMTFKASITDANLSDTHQLSWSLDGKVIATGNAQQLVLKPASLSLGRHTLALTAKDSGSPALSGKTELVFELKETDTPAVAGALGWPWLLLFVPLLGYRSTQTRRAA